MGESFKSAQHQKNLAALGRARGVKRGKTLKGGGDLHYRIKFSVGEVRKSKRESIGIKNILKKRTNCKGPGEKKEGEERKTEGLRPLILTHFGGKKKDLVNRKK